MNDINFDIPILEVMLAKRRSQLQEFFSRKEDKTKF